ncbi:META domain-containing protein [uncultured Cyclobacterium sp.]|uniref:META domain-containing protein n=1 Tax=uncultured Cyclobacterium sp. TaxID=453820 RepID=UPI0030EE4D76|tara:strand:- start:155223 stop:155627 length:405 start_codon:yes stop_codon:yes gene_type:complete
MNFDFKTSLILLIIVFCFSCNSEPIELSDHDWKVTDLTGSAATKKELSKLSLLFKEDKKIGGFAGCNNYRGGATYNQEQIKFSTLYSDNSSCENDEIEQRFLSNLESSKKYTYNAGNLILQDESGNILIELEQI